MTTTHLDELQQRLVRRRHRHRRRRRRRRRYSHRARRVTMTTINRQ